MIPAADDRLPVFRNVRGNRGAGVYWTAPLSRRVATANFIEVQGEQRRPGDRRCPQIQRVAY
jgi:hypothetical protein